MIAPIIEFGTVAGWVTASSSVTMLGLLLRFLPKWVEVRTTEREARTAERQSDSDIAKEIRDELLGRLNECEVKHKEMQDDNDGLRGRIIILEDGDRRKTIAITLLMNEVSRLDPSSDIILRAKGVLEIGVTLITPYDEKIEKSLRDLEKEK